MMIRINLPLIATLFILILGSCKAISTNSNKELKIWVNSFKLKCSDVGNTRCLLIQKGDELKEKSWEYLYGGIKDFKYESGYIYRLKVERRKREYVSDNQSTFVYKLIEVLEKKTDPLVRLHDMWLVSSIGGMKMKEHNEPFVKLDMTKGIVSGHDSCNNFKGNILKVDGRNLQFDFIAVTRKMCSEMITSNAFQNAMRMIRKYKYDGNELHLLSKEGELVMTLKKAVR